MSTNPNEKASLDPVGTRETLAEQVDGSVPVRVRVGWSADVPGDASPALDLRDRTLGGLSLEGTKSPAGIGEVDTAVGSRRANGFAPTDEAPAGPSSSAAVVAPPQIPTAAGVVSLRPSGSGYADVVHPDVAALGRRIGARTGVPSAPVVARASGRAVVVIPESAPALERCRCGIERLDGEVRQLSSARLLAASAHPTRGLAVTAELSGLLRQNSGDTVQIADGSASSGRVSSRSMSADSVQEVRANGRGLAPAATSPVAPRGREMRPALFPTTFNPSSIVVALGAATDQPASPRLGGPSVWRDLASKRRSVLYPRVGTSTRTLGQDVLWGTDRTAIASPEGDVAGVHANSNSTSRAGALESTVETESPAFLAARGLHRAVAVRGTRAALAPGGVGSAQLAAAIGLRGKLVVESLGSASVVAGETSGAANQADPQVPTGATPEFDRSEAFAHVVGPTLHESRRGAGKNSVLAGSFTSSRRDAARAGAVALSIADQLGQIRGFLELANPKLAEHAKQIHDHELWLNSLSPDLANHPDVVAERKSLEESKALQSAFESRVKEAEGAAKDAILFLRETKQAWRDADGRSKVALANLTLVVPDGEMARRLIEQEAATRRRLDDRSDRRLIRRVAGTEFIPRLLAKAAATRADVHAATTEYASARSRAVDAETSPKQAARQAASAERAWQEAATTADQASAAMAAIHLKAVSLVGKEYESARKLEERASHVAERMIETQVEIDAANRVINDPTKSQEDRSAAESSKAAAVKRLDELEAALESARSTAAAAEKRADKARDAYLSKPEVAGALKEYERAVKTVAAIESGRLAETKANEASAYAERANDASLSPEMREYYEDLAARAAEDAQVAADRSGEAAADADSAVADDAADAASRAADAVKHLVKACPFCKCKPPCGEGQVCVCSPFLRGDDPLRRWPDPPPPPPPPPGATTVTEPGFELPDGAGELRRDGGPAPTGPVTTEADPVYPAGTLEGVEVLDSEEGGSEFEESDPDDAEADARRERHAALFDGLRPDSGSAVGLRRNAPPKSDIARPEGAGAPSSPPPSNSHPGPDLPPIPPNADGTITIPEDRAYRYNIVFPRDYTPTKDGPLPEDVEVRETFGDRRVGFIRDQAYIDRVVRAAVLSKAGKRAQPLLGGAVVHPISAYGSAVRATGQWILNAIPDSPTRGVMFDAVVRHSGSSAMVALNDRFERGEGPTLLQGLQAVVLVALGKAGEKVVGVIGKTAKTVRRRYKLTERSTRSFRAGLESRLGEVPGLTRGQIDKIVAVSDQYAGRMGTYLDLKNTYNRALVDAGVKRSVISGLNRGKLEAHHIVEQDLLKIAGFTGEPFSSWPAVLLSPERHLQVGGPLRRGTEALKARLAAEGGRLATADEVRSVLRKAYAGHADLLEIALTVFNAENRRR